MAAIAHYNDSNVFNLEPHRLRVVPPCHYEMDICSSPKEIPWVYRLPVEMLSRIFEIGTHETDDHNDPVDFPVQVSAVSRHFRSVACATPSLWTTVTFNTPRPSWYDPNSDEEYEYPYVRDRIWLSRSKACSLDLILCFRDWSWNFKEGKHFFRREHMEHILFLLRPHVGRIRRFTLICDTFAPLHAALLFLAEYGSAMERLETLELYRCNGFLAEHPEFYPWNLADPIALLGGSPAPRLTRVILSGVHADWTRSIAPLSNLKTLELAHHSRDVRPSVFEFIKILRASPNLTSLTVTASGPSPSSTDAQENECFPFLGHGVPRVHLPLLNTLGIGYQQPEDAFSLLYLVHAPHIVNLSLKDTSRPSESETAGGSSILTSIADHSSRLFPRLELFSLDSVKTTAEAFAAYLDAYPGIFTLKLGHVSRDVLSVLSSPSPSTPSRLPCPALRELSLQLMPGLGIGAVAKARAAAGMRLDALSIHFGDKISDQELALAQCHSKEVKFFGQSAEDSDDESMDWGENDDPYAPGGAFNDPEFDAMFS